MSLYEAEESSGEISLLELFDNHEKHIFGPNDNYTLYDTAFYLCRGGWPLSIAGGREKALRITSAYYSTLFDFENLGV